MGKESESLREEARVLKAELEVGVCVCLCVCVCMRANTMTFASALLSPEYLASSRSLAVFLRHDSRTSARR